MGLCCADSHHVHSASGGLAAVIYTDTLQTIIMVVGSFILMGYGNVSLCIYVPHAARSLFSSSNNAISLPHCRPPANYLAPVIPISTFSSLLLLVHL